MADADGATPDPTPVPLRERTVGEVLAWVDGAATALDRRVPDRDPQTQGYRTCLDDLLAFLDRDDDAPTREDDQR